MCAFLAAFCARYSTRTNTTVRNGAMNMSVENQVEMDARLCLDARLVSQAVDRVKSVLRATHTQWYMLFISPLPVPFSQAQTD